MVRTSKRQRCVLLHRWDARAVTPLPLSLYQNLNLQTVVTILNSTKSTEIPGVIRSLSEDAQDTLMKYLYKGMALPGWGDVSGSVLLGWHEKVRITLPPCHVFSPFTSVGNSIAHGSRWDWVHRQSDDRQETSINRATTYSLYNTWNILSLVPVRYSRVIP